MAEHLIRHATAAVADGDDNEFTGRCLRVAEQLRGAEMYKLCGDIERSAVWHGVSSVDNQVDQNLLDLRLVSHHCRQVERAFDLDFDVLPEDTMEQ